jgi:hypothetical protein
MTFDEVVRALGEGADAVAKIRELTAAHGDVAVDEAVRLTLADRDAEIATLRAQLAPALGSPAPTPMPSPGPSSQATSDDVPGFDLIFSEAFDTECAEGDFVRLYGQRWAPYPLGWKDTSKKGVYNPGIISVAQGVLNMLDRGEVHPVPAAAGGHPEFARMPDVGGVAAINSVGRRDQVQRRRGAHRCSSPVEAADRFSSARRSSTSRWA